MKSGPEHTSGFAGQTLSDPVLRLFYLISFETSADPFLLAEQF